MCATTKHESPGAATPGPSTNRSATELKGTNIMTQGIPADQRNAWVDLVATLAARAFPEIERITFDEVIAAWDAPLCCQTTQSPKPCRNHARWIAVNSHFSHCLGWPRTSLLCTLHKTRWVEITREKIAA